MNATKHDYMDPDECKCECSGCDCPWCYLAEAEGALARARIYGEATEPGLLATVPGLQRGAWGSAIRLARFAKTSPLLTNHEEADAIIHEAETGLAGLGPA
jgi:hypothetical protein